jgi:hypothetical protein
MFIKVKVYFALEQVIKAQKGNIDILLYSFFNLGARWGGWLAPRPCRFTPMKGYLVLII